MDGHTEEITVNKDFIDRKKTLLINSSLLIHPYLYFSNSTSTKILVVTVTVTVSP